MHFIILAYLSTTVSTIAAMIASFFASQQTFCFLQLQAEQESSTTTLKTTHHFSHLDADSLLTKVKELNFKAHFSPQLNRPISLQDLVKRHNDPGGSGSSGSNNNDEQLNLKTPSSGHAPSGPQPHPSWVYRYQCYCR